MIAQHGYGKSAKPRIRYAALRDCLYHFKDIALIKRAGVHMPRIGTGYAGGNWSYILELIDEILVRNGVDVTIYTIPDYEPAEAPGFTEKSDLKLLAKSSNPNAVGSVALQFVRTDNSIVVPV